MNVTAWLETWANSTIVYGTPFARLDGEGKEKKELVLSNAQLMGSKIAALELSVKKLTAIRETGEEQVVTNFLGQLNMKIGGMHSGRFLKSRSLLALEPGQYEKLRFYVEPLESTYVNWEGIKVQYEAQEYLEFDIQDGLSLSGDEFPEVVLWFDLVPFRLFSKLKNLFSQNRLVMTRNGCIGQRPYSVS